MIMVIECLDVPLFRCSRSNHIYHVYVYNSALSLRSWHPLKYGFEPRVSTCPAVKADEVILKIWFLKK